jgi:hypothetical protein
MDEVIVKNEEQAFKAIRDAIEKLYEEGYRKVDVRTSQDENGNMVVYITPRLETSAQSSKNKEEH